MTFTYSVTALDWARIAPELVLAAITLILMMVDLFLPQTGSGPKDKHSGASNFYALPIISVVGILGAFAATITLFLVGPLRQYLVLVDPSVPRDAFNNMISADWGSLYGYLIVLSASLMGVLFSPAYLKRLNLVHQGEYYALLMLATIGMMLLVAAASFLTVFIGIEMLSLALYILCGFVARRKSSQESGMKYFLLSSFASAFLLYGIALTYGATGKTAFIDIASFLSLHGGGSFATHAMLLIGMGLLAVGFAFKVSAIPFQAWTPDVYEGAPAPITAFMSVGTKAAAIIAFARVFGIVFARQSGDWLQPETAPRVFKHRPRRLSPDWHCGNGVDEPCSSGWGYWQHTVITHRHACCHRAGVDSLLPALLYLPEYGCVWYRVAARTGRQFWERYTGLAWSVVSPPRAIRLPRVLPAGTRGLPADGGLRW